MWSFTLPEEGVDGSCGPMTSPPGKVCRATSGHGRKAVFGRGLMNSPVRKLENQAEGRKARTRMIDSQAVKRQKKGAHYDAGQKIKARKGHLLVDRLRLIPSLSVQAADRPDPDGAKWGPPKVAVTATGLTLIWAEGGDGGKLMARVQESVAGGLK